MNLVIITDTSGIKNYYPDLPVYQFEQDTIPEADMLACVKALPYSAEEQAAILTITDNEDGNGGYVILDNTCGFQADNSAWPSMWDGVIIGTTVLVDSTGAMRRFLVFKDYQSCVAMMGYYVNARGMYIGGNASVWAGITLVATPEDAYTAYARGWIYGDINYQPVQSDIDDYTSLLNKNLLLLQASTAPVTTAPAVTAPSVVHPIYKMQLPMMKSDVIGKIQTVLAAQGYYSGKIDDIYWKLTFAAVRKFQKANGLTVDGEVGVQTFLALDIA